MNAFEMSTRGPYNASYAPFVADWARGIGLPPKFLEGRITRAGHAHLLPRHGNLAKMMNGKRGWPPPLLEVAVHQLGTSTDIFLGISRRPFYADGIVDHTNALTAGHWKNEDDVRDALEPVLCGIEALLGGIRNQLHLNEAAAVTRLAEMRPAVIALVNAWARTGKGAVSTATPQPRGNVRPLRSHR